ncbi:hypothetical protein B0I22_1681 [Epilithonimonas xixisoli]|uniref:Uncharacterized protein n=1 Tax=Epilithonimonas xixisoli TaxID=1476462 RepID=A0A4R8I6R5_9FLAO|nr:hypothetical protein B0I22_1681 [Epilithonimonas xixisoli]
MKPAKPTMLQLMIKKELPNPDTSQLSNTEKLTIYWIYPNENSPFMVGVKIFICTFPSSHQHPSENSPFRVGVQIYTIHHPSSNQSYTSPIQSL